MENGIAEMQTLLKKQKNRWLRRTIVWLLIFILCNPLLSLATTYDYTTASIYAATLLMIISFVGALSSPIAEYLMFAHYADLFKDYDEKALRVKKVLLIVTWILESVYGLIILYILNAAFTASFIFVGTLLDFLLVQAFVLAIYEHKQGKKKAAIVMTVEIPVMIGLLVLAYNFLPESNVIDKASFREFTSLEEFTKYAESSPTSQAPLFSQVNIKCEDYWTYQTRANSEPINNLEDQYYAGAINLNDRGAYQEFDYNDYFAIYDYDNNSYAVTFHLKNTDISYINFYMKRGNLVASVLTGDEYSTTKTLNTVIYSVATGILSFIAIALIFAAFYKKKEKKHNS